MSNLQHHFSVAYDPERHTLYSTPAPHSLPTTISLHGRMTEQERNALPIMRPPYRLRQRRTNIDLLQLRTLLPLLRKRYRIRSNDSTQGLAIIERIQCTA